MRWQDVRDLGLNLFKKRNRSRTLWIGGGTAFFSIFAFIVLLTGIEVTHTGDIECANECISYVNVSSSYWRICFADDIDLVRTDPEIDVIVYVPTYGKRWRLFDPKKDCIERQTKYRPLPNRFKIVGFKEPEQTVKWNIDRFDVDPLWKGAKKLTRKCIRYEEQKIIDKYTIYIHNEENNTDVPKEVNEPTIRPVCVEYEYFLEYGGKNISERTLGMRCRMTDVITCDSVNDGNGDGICQPGESCLIYDKEIEAIGHLSKKIEAVI